MAHNKNLDFDVIVSPKDGTHVRNESQDHLK